MENEDAVRRLYRGVILGEKTPSTQCLQLECFLGLKDSLDNPFCHGFTPGPGKQSMALIIF